jgi:IS4 transposase
MDKNTRFSSFGKWVAPINMKLFNEQVEKHHLDKYTKKLKTLSFTKLFLYAHLNQMESLHDLNTALADKDLQKELGFQSISVSQLSRKNKSMDPEFLSAIFLELVRLIHLKTEKRKGINPIKIIDSSTMPLNLTRCQWAHFRKSKAGVKLHLRLVYVGQELVYPEKAIMTNAAEHDRNQLEILVDDKDAMYVFDRGYVDYERFDRYTDDGVFFLSRLKKNAVIREIETFDLPEDSSVTSDKMVYIGTAQKRCDNVFRIIETVDSKGQLLRLITNRFDLTAEEISDLYRSRWAIELFFKWLKQHVKIKTFFGYSEEAVHNQLFLALITYCLNVLIQLETKSKKTLLQISRWLKRTLWRPARVWLSYMVPSGIP